MRIKTFMITIIAAFIPFLFAVNILRTQTKGQENFMGTNGFLQLASEINFSFSDTYVSIAEAGKNWNKQSDDPNVSNFFSALWNSIKIPFVAIGESLESTYDCIMVFIKFVGIIPDGLDNNIGNGNGGGGGGGGTRPA